MAINSAYRRRIRITTAAGQARADLEDDPHRYGVIVAHDGQRALSVRGLTLRTPWTLCKDAAAMLAKAEGVPLGTEFGEFYQQVDASLQCTHMADLAALAIAHAGHGTARRQYDVEVTGPATGERQFAAMEVDGAAYLNWTIEGTRIVSPGRYAGEDLRTMMRAVHAAGDPSHTEAIQVLRRAVFVARSRRLDLDKLRNAAETGHVPGACYVFQPGLSEHALRIRGATRDFTHRREQMLIDLENH